MSGTDVEKSKACAPECEDCGVGVGTEEREDGKRLCARCFDFWAMADNLAEEMSLGVLLEEGLGALVMASGPVLAALRPLKEAVEAEKPEGWQTPVLGGLTVDDVQQFEDAAANAWAKAAGTVVAALVEIGRLAVAIPGIEGEEERERARDQLERLCSAYRQRWDAPEAEGRG